MPKHRDHLALKPFEMAALTAFVVKAEGPIHAEEVARRIREAFGLERTGSRILNKINEALRTAERLGGGHPRRGVLGSAATDFDSLSR